MTAPTTARVDRRLASAPPEALFVLSAISLYLGAAVAVKLFDHLHPAAVAWLRVSWAALFVVAWRRPWRSHWTRAQLGWAAAFGVTLAFMNLSFYMAIDRLHLGTAVAIEFLGPIAVAVVLTRTTRNLVALAVAIAGVALLTEVSTDADAAGVGFALLAAALWAGYILLGRRVATSGFAVDGLGVGMVLGAVAITPFGLSNAGGIVDTPWVVLGAAAVGLLSSAVPYVLDQVVLARLSADRFALLLALLPATATVVGIVVLGQLPSVAEAVGIGLVVAGIAIRDRATDPPIPQPVAGARR